MSANIAEIVIKISFQCCEGGNNSGHNVLSCPGEAKPVTGEKVGSQLVACIKKLHALSTA